MMEKKCLPGFEQLAKRISRRNDYHKDVAMLCSLAEKSAGNSNDAVYEIDLLIRQILSVFDKSRL